MSTVVLIPGPACGEAAALTPPEQAQEIAALVPRARVSALAPDWLTWINA
ncbi:MAG: hypothetical protein IH627_03490 [Rubrivivax sp.]|nr:hypothetical protein [Rubrivivax sp.]